MSTRQIFLGLLPHLDSIPSKSIFDLVHCDVWEPSQVPSILGILYYIVFVDDFSHASWVYLLKDRTDVLPYIHQILQEISTQYSKTPKILCIDNVFSFFFKLSYKTYASPLVSSTKPHSLTHLSRTVLSSASTVTNLT